MKAIIIGGTGATGREVISCLLTDETIKEVISLVRTAKATPHPKLTEIEINFDQLNQYQGQITGDIAFSCLGTTLKIAGSKAAQWRVDYDYQYAFARLAKANAIPRFVLLSAQNANPKAWFFYPQLKGQLEESVKALQFERLLIAQPSLLLRPESQRRGEIWGAKVLQSLNAIGLLQNYQPLSVATVAKALVIAGKSQSDPVQKIGVPEIINIQRTGKNR